MLRVPWGYVGALQCDPIEKKPFFHALPGSDALSFGMLGCDLHCGVLPELVHLAVDPRPARRSAPPRDVSARRRSRTSRSSSGAPTVVSTYNEPLITSEWAVEVFREAKRRGLRHARTSPTATARPQVLDYIRPWVDFYKVDLKSMDDKHYRRARRRARRTSSTRSAGIHERGIWLEVLTLVIPGFNDSEDELRRAAAFVASVSPDIPWHVTAFHPDYKMNDRGATPAETLVRAARDRRGGGPALRLRGQPPRPGRGVGEHALPQLRGRRVIERRGFVVAREPARGRRRAPRCATPIPGRWDAARRGDDPDARDSAAGRLSSSPASGKTASRVRRLVQPPLALRSSSRSTGRRGLP